MSPTDHQYGSDPDATQAGLTFSAVIQKIVMGAIRWMTEVLTLSETEQVEAGILLSRQGRDQ
ncbi:MAG: hypothetical protein WBR18_05230 [Anaerolineales bacterium]